MTFPETTPPSTATEPASQYSEDDPFGLDDIPDFLRCSPGKTKGGASPVHGWEIETMTNISIKAATPAVYALKGFIPPAQMDTMGTLSRGEEGQFFLGKFIEYAERVASMPKTYEQDGMGDKAVAYLHYFSGGCDWYITEKDMEDEQHQAFGWADLGYGGELGYISLVELCRCPGVELDLHFTPTKLGTIKQDKAA